ncbi:class I SAM-dependent methyltransferase [Thermodesulfobacterium hveragerdense]|uniref:class I SAM-dependent methyltransferase n=1 Tax=Thermodesulfobacterium hveragerdense TaxID=53424 RepID=UPI000418BD69|nr:class I SAM-dependent methyltransferase [Thermodesulfobacterium hveragerdense]
MVVLIDEEPVAEGVADRFREDLLDAGIGDGKHAFAIDIPEKFADGKEYEIKVVIKNLEKELGSVKFSKRYEVIFFANCPICERRVKFISTDDYYSCRDVLFSPDCPLNRCVTRERAVAYVLFREIPKQKLFEEKIIYEQSPALRGLSLLLKKHAKHYHACGYYPDRNFGEYVNGLRNENLEELTLPDESVDVWIHLDVLEHVFDPIRAIREIYRTLKKGGICIFTTPTQPGLLESKQVALKMPDGTVKIIGNPEYHGNPQNPKQGSLVTWKYGYDLPYLIQSATGFDVEVFRFQSFEIAVCGLYTEVYLCRKR